MKLKVYKDIDKEKRKKSILIVSLAILFLVIGVILYQTYAVYKVEVTKSNISGNVGTSSDIEVSFYIDNNIVAQMPTKGDIYTFDHGECSNGASIEFNDVEWNIKVLNLTQTRTKCKVYFVGPTPPAQETIASLVGEDVTDNINCNGTGGIVNDDPNNNPRYIGKCPANYVSFNNELWRIIGVFDVDNGTGTIEKRLKIIRNESIGDYSWKTSDSSVNDGYGGVNEWSQADLTKLLNPGYESEPVGGSLYYNQGTGNCYSDINNITTACDFSSSGLGNEAKTLIEDAVWHLGSPSNNNGTFDNESGLIPTTSYQRERSGIIAKLCSSGWNCNNKVTRTTSWRGLVGLIYPSDYGYATGGGQTKNRQTCLEVTMSNWKNSDNADCKNNDWLLYLPRVYLSSSALWTLSPFTSPSSDYYVFEMTSDGAIIHNHTGISCNVYPTVYLKSGVTITGGDGTQSNPYTLGL